MTFGQVLAEARKKAGLSQKALAGRIAKEDGQPISPQYLNDIEHDRRNPPPDFLIEQFATTLHTPSAMLYYWAGRLPPDVRGVCTSAAAIIVAYDGFRATLLRR